MSHESGLLVIGFASRDSFRGRGSLTQCTAAFLRDPTPDIDYSSPLFSSASLFSPRGARVRARSFYFEYYFSTDIYLWGRFTRAIFLYYYSSDHIYIYIYIHTPRVHHHDEVVVVVAAVVVPLRRRQRQGVCCDKTRGALREAAAGLKQTSPARPSAAGTSSRSHNAPRCGHTRVLAACCVHTHTRT